MGERATVWLLLLLAVLSSASAVAAVVPPVPAFNPNPTLFRDPPLPDVVADFSQTPDYFMKGRFLWGVWAGAIGVGCRVR